MTGDGPERNLSEGAADGAAGGTEGLGEAVALSSGAPAGGYETALADISTSLLDFARFRLSRRGQEARFIDLNDEQLAAGRYDVITALDTLILVPDLADVVAGLHAALRPEGWLITNFDVRPPSPENAWHLYDDDLNLRAILHRAGFAPSSSFGEYLVYRRADPAAAPGAARPARPHQPSPPRHPPPEPAPGRRDPAEDRWLTGGYPARKAGPAFYHRPSTIDDLLTHTCGKVLDQFGLDHDLYRRWTG